MIQEKIENLLKELGVYDYGFGLLKNYVPTQYNMLETGISFGIPLSQVVMNEITDYEPTHTYFHHYRSVNAFIDHVALRMVMMLQREGYDAVAVPASQSINKPGFDYEGLFQHRTAATRAGMGWIGKNGSLIHPIHGPRIRLGTILTNAVVEYAEPMNESKCGTCKACVLKCPSMALTGINWTLGLDRKELLNAEVCSKHMSTHYKHIGRGVVCGICLKACPVGRRNSHG